MNPGDKVTSIYCLSDLHLGGGDSDQEIKKTARLLSFLDYISGDAKAIYLVGDIFDFWFEYRSVMPRMGIRILAALRKLADLGVRVVFLPGNHDLWIGRTLTDDWGFEVESGPLTVETQGIRIRMLHGDGLEMANLRYLWYKRWVLTNPLCIRMFGWLHPDFARQLGTWVAQFTRWRDAVRYRRDQGGLAGEDEGPPFWRKAYSVAAADLLEDYDLVLLGHVHVGRLDVYPEGKLVVLGDWRAKFMYAKIEDGRVSLRTWTEGG